eukprot:CAMPEP_0113321232 /NCGR_PEP_ID=MMETSP0010_2-20120614/14781_1 /TAXON_ID=216773 ORGANISM="Corethron hystrix, Strain 308" /NCGR_SAMPLE_ID=MMETSP0010_2 /ASSEMBLY_ACC=CAM_ASM_000155 /LENGTH=570 /DNA_ID=CAMNT_0000179289 /DNA_START=41 /DNA_END=1753 /DNA_ORIENTATION=+ /assembly_acc=CAM_ASM_000155
MEDDSGSDEGLCQWSEGGDKDMASEIDNENSHTSQFDSMPSDKSSNYVIDQGSNDNCEIKSHYENDSSQSNDSESILDPNISSDHDHDDVISVDSQEEDFVGIPSSSSVWWDDHPNNQVPDEYRKVDGWSGDILQEYDLTQSRFKKVNLATFHCSALTPLVRNIPHGLSCPLCNGLGIRHASTGCSTIPEDTQAFKGGGELEETSIQTLLLDVVTYKSSTHSSRPDNVLLTHTPALESDVEYSFSEDDDGSSDQFNNPLRNFCNSHITSGSLSQHRIRYESVSRTPEGWGGAGRFLSDAKHAASIRCTAPGCPFEAWAPMARCISCPSGQNGAEGCAVYLSEMVANGGCRQSEATAIRIRRNMKKGGRYYNEVGMDVRAALPFHTMKSILLGSDLGTTVPRDTYIRKRCASAGCIKSVRCMSCSNGLYKGGLQMYSKGLQSCGLSSIKSSQVAFCCGLCGIRHCRDCRFMINSCYINQRVGYICCGSQARNRRMTGQNEDRRVHDEESKGPEDVFNCHNIDDEVEEAENEMDFDYQYDGPDELDYEKEMDLQNDNDLGMSSEEDEFEWDG